MGKAMWGKIKSCWMILRGQGVVIPYATPHQYRVWYNENKQQIEAMNIPNKDFYIAELTKAKENL
jgi:hypothetical protein